MAGQLAHQTESGTSPARRLKRSPPCRAARYRLSRPRSWRHPSFDAEHGGDAGGIVEGACATAQDFPAAGSPSDVGAFRTRGRHLSSRQVAHLRNAWASAAALLGRTGRCRGFRTLPTTAHTGTRYSCSLEEAVGPPRSTILLFLLARAVLMPMCPGVDAPGEDFAAPSWSARRPRMVVSLGLPISGRRSRPLPRIWDRGAAGAPQAAGRPAARDDTRRRLSAPLRLRYRRPASLTQADGDLVGSGHTARTFESSARRRRPRLLELHAGRSRFVLTGGSADEWRIGHMERRRAAGARIG